MKISKANLPPNFLVQKAFLSPTFSDAFVVTIHSGKIPEPSEVMKVFFFSINPFILFFFFFREILAKVLGLKTINFKKTNTELKDFSGKVGEAIGLLIVLDKSETELLTGQNDKSLDFRISFIVNTTKSGFQIMIATSIKTKDSIGNIYLFIVKPFHKFLMPIILKKMARQFELK